MSGYDTLYLKDLKDDDLIENARETGRILISRDKELVIKARKRNLVAYLAEGASTLDKLIDLREKMGLEYYPQNIRCPRCNGRLEKVAKSQVADTVPEASYHAFNDFWKCINCSAVYWEGSHWEKIKSTLEKANQ